MPVSGYYRQSDYVFLCRALACCHTQRRRPRIKSSGCVKTPSHMRQGRDLRGARSLYINVSFDQRTTILLFYNTNCINLDYGETLVTGDILFKYPAYGNHLISWVCRKKHQYHFFFYTTRTTTSLLDVTFGRHFVYVTFRCHF